MLIIVSGGPQASRALVLLTPSERAAVLKYMHAHDARMALGSHLLKHYVVAKTCGIAWAASNISRDARHKPIFVDPATGRQPLAFNVSHQAGLVAVAGVRGYGGGQIDVGVDVVSPAERRVRDHRMVHEDGWLRFVDMHADVFGTGEAEYLKYQVRRTLPRGADAAGRPVSAEALTDFKLRAFYTLWCLREAYVKMTGDALVAPWLHELQFRNLVPPKPVEALQDLDEEGLGTSFDIWFKGNKVENVNVSLRAYGVDYMTCTMVRTPDNKEDGLGLRLGRFRVLTLDEILDFARTSM